jgi:hypothetical protein
MGQTQVAKFSRSEPVGLPLSAGNEARAAYSKLTILSHLQPFVSLTICVEMMADVFLSSKIKEKWEAITNFDEPQ